MAPSNQVKVAWVWPGWTKQLGRRFLACLLPAALAAAVLLNLFASWTRVFEVYELQAYDWRSRLALLPAKNSPILIVEIADDTLEQLGQWPVDRMFHATLLDALGAYGAKSAGVDILFVEPSDSDAHLVSAAEIFDRAYFCEALDNPHPVNGRVETGRVLSPLLPELKQLGRETGHVNVTVDADGKRRRVPAVIWENGKPRFQLGLLLAMDYLGVKPSDVRFEPGVILIGDKVRIPVDENGETLVRFHGLWKDAFEHISYVDVLKAYRAKMTGKKPDADMNRLKGRVCMIGLTAPGTHDINPTPVDSMYPQVGLHADFFQNVIDGDFMRRFPRWINLIAAILLGWGGWQVSRIRRLILSVSAAVGIWSGFVLLNIALFVWARYWLDLFFPSILWWSVYLSMIVWRTMQEMHKRELLEAEMSIASKIQRSFLPSALPVLDGYEMAVFMRPAKHVGGDLYAALKLDDRHLGIMCGDVSGKGMPAALFMARSVAEFRFHAASGTDPAETLRRLNNGLADAESSGLFVTVNYAVVDLPGKKLVLSNGGHMPVVRIRRDGTNDLLSPDGGMPIGLIGDVDFGRMEVDFDPGDVFLMYSDGVSEARNRKVQDFEIERVVRVAAASRAQTASAICSRIIQAVDTFAAGAPQHDDMTLFVFKVLDV